jgi:hypothetical protein
MLAKLLGRLTYANVVATLALFLALGGVSYGALRIKSRDLVNNTVRTQDLRNNNIRSKDIRNNNIRSKDIRNRTIVGRDVLTSTITGLQVRETSLGKVPDADKLDGQESVTFRDRCPAGTLLHAGACFERLPRSAAVPRTAARTCGASNRRLALWSELESLRRESAVTTAGPELTSDLSGMNSVFTIDPDDGTVDTVSFGDTAPFRCVAPLSDQ